MASDYEFLVIPLINWSFTCNVRRTNERRRKGVNQYTNESLALSLVYLIYIVIEKNSRVYAQNVQAMWTLIDLINHALYV